MIFGNINESSYYDVDINAIQESPYELGLAGGLMHVYETECNYNSLMRAVGLSEMKYAMENNGAELFVHEAGAFSSFLKKAKDLFMKVIEKIKQIFKKFCMTINGFIGKDKDFVKKYGTELKKINLKDFEFTGYDFKKTLSTFKAEYSDVAKWKSIESDYDKNTYDTSTAPSMGNYENETYDKLDDYIEERRGRIIDKGKLTENEYMDELKEMLYGDKDTLKGYTTTEMLDVITSTKTNVDAVEKEQKDIIKAINDCIKAVENFDKRLDDNIKNSDNPGIIEDHRKTQSFLNAMIKVYKASSSDMTTLFSMKAKAYKDQNRQAKAFCIKAMGYKPKNESARISSDPFANVVIC